MDATFFLPLLIAAALLVGSLVLTELPRVATLPSLVSPLPTIPTLLPADTSPPVPSVAGSTTVKPEPIAPPPPSPTMTPTPSAQPSPRASTASVTETSLVFTDLPARVHTGESFTINWGVVGPAGIRGENATLKVTYQAHAEAGNSSSRTNSNTTNSFGTFTMPASFSSRYSFGNAPATIQIVATADINGTTLKKEASIELIE